MFVVFERYMQSFSLSMRSVDFYLFELGRAVKMPDHMLRSLPANPLKDETSIAKHIFFYIELFNCLEIVPSKANFF